MQKPEIKNIYDLIAYLKPLFDRHSYKNISFHQGIIIAVIVLVAVWLGSGIYFANKVFNFVTGSITTHTEAVESNINGTRDQLGYTGKKMKEYWDEKYVAEEIEAEQKKESNLKEIEGKKQEIDGLINWLQNASAQEIEQNNGKVSETMYYLKGCLSDINIWSGERAGSIQAKQRLAIKYQKDISEKKYRDKGEKRAMEEYIARVKEIDPNYSRDYLIRLLKEKDLAGIKMEGEWHNFEKMQACLHMADKVIPALYYSYYNVDRPSVIRGYTFFSYLEYLANGFQISQILDFTVPFILAEETNLLTSNVEFTKDQDIFETMRLKASFFPYYASKAMTIFERTNQKLAQINHENMGFKTGAYKYRLENYNFWKEKWKDLQKPQKAASSNTINKKP